MKLADEATDLLRELTHWQRTREYKHFRFGHDFAWIVDDLDNDDIKSNDRMLIRTALDYLEARRWHNANDGITSIMSMSMADKITAFSDYIHTQEVIPFKADDPLAAVSMCILESKYAPYEWLVLVAVLDLILYRALNRIGGVK